MDRLGSFLLGLVAGVTLALGVKHFMDEGGINLDDLEASIGEKLDALEGLIAEPA
ncbi:MAG: hypothetical protein IT205_06775 [Fimbriimonadaceae bacterium]|nr:hypothetical protein [Fimbriimonadaceae bacterium]MCC7102601.1 hypothetical protein [Fimbriimonadaceae bacterium]